MKLLVSSAPLPKTTFCMWTVDRHGELSYDKRTPDNASEGVVAFQKFYLGSEGPLDTDTAKRCGTVASVLSTSSIGIGDLGYLPKAAADAMAQKLASDPPAQVMFTRIMETQISGKLRAAQPAPTPAAGPTFVSATIRQADGDNKTIFEQMLGELDAQESGPSDPDFLQFFPKEWSLSCLPRGDVVITTVKCASKMQGRFFPGGDIPKEFFPSHIPYTKKEGKVSYGSYPAFQEVLIRMLSALIPIQDYPVVDVSSMLAYIQVLNQIAGTKTAAGSGPSLAITYDLEARTAWSHERSHRRADFDVKAAMRKVDNDILAKAKSSMPSQSKPTPRARPDPRGVPKSLVIGRGGDCVEYWHGRCKLSAADCEYKHEKQDPQVRAARDQPRRGARRQNDEDDYLERPGAKRR